MSDENGVALIQVIMAAAIFSVLSLAMSKLIIEQRQSNAYLEDQLEKIAIIRNLETTLQDGLACQQTLSGLLIRSTGSSNVSDLKDSHGNVIYNSNSIQGNLRIGQIRVSNQTVPSPNSSGFVNIYIPLSRNRTGGGPSHFKTLEHKIKVTVDSSRRVTNCSTSNMEVLESGTGYDGQTGHQACSSIGKSCSHIISLSTITDDAGCPGATHCMRVCMTWYNQSLPGIPNTVSFATSANNNVHNCDARVGFYTSYLHSSVVRCGTYFSAVCM